MIGRMESFARHWTIESRRHLPEITGSFGACPKPVLEAQSELRARLEREPVDFMGPRMGAAHGRGAADFSRGSWAPIPNGLAFVSNATGGVKHRFCVRFVFSPGDEILIFDPGLRRLPRNAARFAAERAGSAGGRGSRALPADAARTGDGRDPRASHPEGPVWPSSTT